MKAERYHCALCRTWTKVLVAEQLGWISLRAGPLARKRWLCPECWVRLTRLVLE